MENWVVFEETIQMLDWNIHTYNSIPYYLDIKKSSKSPIETYFSICIQDLLLSHACSSGASIFIVSRCLGIIVIVIALYLGVWVLLLLLLHCIWLSGYHCYCYCIVPGFWMSGYYRYCIVSGCFFSCCAVHLHYYIITQLGLMYLSRPFHCHLKSIDVYHTE